MSGVPAPVYPIVRPFGSNAVDPDYITLPIPETPEPTVGMASFELGFPPATMSDPESAGGVPPFGEDMNGILYMLSQYAALAQAGQIVPWSAAASYEIGGYKIGAKVASVTTPGRVWTNWLDGNEADPDADETGWAADDALYATDAPAAGSYDDVVIPGASDYALDVDTSAGDVSYTGFVPQRSSQRLFISNTGANLLNLPSLTGSAANNQLRGIAGGLTLISGQTVTLQYIDTLNKWLFV